MTTFEKDYKKAKKYISKDDVSNLKKYIIYTLQPYLKSMQSQNPDLTLEEFEDLLREDYLDLGKTAFKSSFAFDYYMLYISCQYLKSNPKVFDEIHDRIKKWGNKS